MSENHQPPVPDETPTVWGGPPASRTDAAGSVGGVAAGSLPAGAPQTGYTTLPDGSVVESGVEGRPGRKRISTMAKTLTAVGVAAVIAVGGTIAVTSANAASSSSSTQGGPGGSGQGGPGGFGGGTGTGATGGTGTTDTGGTGTGGTGGMGTGTRGGGFGEMAVIGSALHGEFVVADGTGTITERIQTGAVTAVSSTSITVRSTDDYSAAYTLTSGLDVSAFTTGTDVTVIATVSGSTVTATAVTAARTAGGMGGGPGTGTGTGTTGGTGAGQGTTGGNGSTGSGSTDSGAPTI